MKQTERRENSHGITYWEQLKAAILLLFNTADKLSYSDISTKLNCSDEDVLRRLLHSLCCTNYKILLKEPNNEKISQNDIFEFNSKFTDKRRRIKIPLPHLDERIERKKVFEDVERDRKYKIEATIVRIMKGRKCLEYRQLVLACAEMLSLTFEADIQAIKKQIEDLISREYIERDEINSHYLKYLA